MACAWVSLRARGDLEAGTYEEVSGPIWLEQEKVSESDVLLCGLVTPSVRLRISGISDDDFHRLCERLGARLANSPRPLIDVLQSKWVTRNRAWAKVTYLPSLGVLLEVRDADERQVYVNTRYSPDDHNAGSKPRVR